MPVPLCGQIHSAELSCQLSKYKEKNYVVTLPFSNSTPHRKTKSKTSSFAAIYLKMARLSK